MRIKQYFLIVIANQFVTAIQTGLLGACYV